VSFLNKVRQIEPVSLMNSVIHSGAVSGFGTTRDGVAALRATPHFPPRGTPGALSTLAVAILATALPVLLHLVSRELAIAVCVVLAFLIATCAAPTAIVVLIFSYLFQNLFVAIVSPGIDSLEQFNAARAYNFVLTAVIWATLFARYWITRATFERRFRIVMDVTTIALGLIGIYFVVGFASNPDGAMIYLRNIAAPFLLFQIFALVSHQYRLALTAPLITIAVAALTYGYLEFAAHSALMNLVNGDSYLIWRSQQQNDSGYWLKQLQETGHVLRSHLDTLLVDFLNTALLSDLGIQFYRILGPNFHFISYAYAIAFFAVVLVAVRQRWYALLAFPLLLIVGSKGALILVLLVAAGIAATYFVRRTLVLKGYSILLAAYALGGIALGIRVQDYHVIGFLGGLRGFVSNPLGRGIGVGGNLSMNMTTIDWSKSQYLGHTDTAVESAVGVLLYQMGIFGAALLGLLIWLAIKLWRVYLESGDRLFAAGAFALLVVMVNGIFQEEALFSPLALGMVLGLAGLLLGRAYRARSGAQSSPFRPRPPQFGAAPCRP
jgi:hypothetical protein